MKPLKTETVFFIYKVKDSPNLDESPVTLGKEMDTYKVATVANSESTMHRLAKTPITINCFSFDNIDDIFPLALDRFEDHIQDCELLRKQYLDTQDKRYWRALIQMLPSSWNQTRHWTSNYSTLLNIGHSRENHKLSEWDEFISFLKKNAPYYTEFLEAYNDRKN